MLQPPSFNNTTTSKNIHLQSSLQCKNLKSRCLNLLLVGADTNNHNDVEFFLTKVYSKIMNSSIRTAAAVIYGDEQTAVSLMWSQIAEYPNAHHMWVVPFPGELVPFSGPFDPWWNLQALSKSAFAFRELLGKGQDYCRFFEQVVLAQTRRLSNHDGGRCSEVASTSPEPSKQPNSSRTFRKSCQQQELLPCLVFPLSLWTLLLGIKATDQKWSHCSSEVCLEVFLASLSFHKQISVCQIEHYCFLL